VYFLMGLMAPYQEGGRQMQNTRIALALLVMFWIVGVSDAAAEKVKILDECDPATFNAIGAGILCNVNFDGGVTFPEFASLLSPAAFGHPAWRFDVPYLEIQPNEKVQVRNDGGEDHTFTKVSAFGGGRVDALNAPLGLTALPECAASLAPALRPGDSVQIQGLGEGVYLFECCIHPWMHAVIKVQSADHGDHGHH
jgi:hypothetical protein